MLAGTPTDIADELEAWYVAGAADGFNLMFPVLPVDLVNFAELVVPKLQRRGLTPTMYADGTCVIALDSRAPRIASAGLSSAERRQSSASTMSGFHAFDVADWSVTTPMTDQLQHYDAIVIGAGQAGGPLSTAFARAGGVPRSSSASTSAAPASTRAVRRPRRWSPAPASPTSPAAAQTTASDTGPITIDMAKVRQRKRDIVKSSVPAASGGSPAPRRGPDPRRSAFHRPATARSVDAADRLTAELILINIGARPSTPPIAGLDTIPALELHSIMELDSVPDHLIVLGGGYVGLEFGQMFRRFGSRVTIVQRGPRLLGREDADVADAVADILREDGIDVLLRPKPCAQTGPRLIV